MKATDKKTAIKSELHLLIDKTQDAALLNKVRALLEPELWDELSADEQAEIERGISELDAGNFTSEAESMQKDIAVIRK